MQERGHDRVGWQPGAAFRWGWEPAEWGRLREGGHDGADAGAAAARSLGRSVGWQPGAAFRWSLEPTELAAATALALSLLYERGTVVG